MGKDEPSIKSGSPVSAVFAPLVGYAGKLGTSRRNPHGESIVFRMHYRTTFFFIMVCALLVTATQYLGSKIACLVDKDSVPQKVIDTYCYISNTYTLPSTFDMQKADGVAHPGLGADKRIEEPVYHNYYMWVPYVLFIQGLCFYIPHWLWKMMQNDKVITVLQGLNFLIVNGEDRENKVDNMVDYLSKHWNNYTIWSMKYVFCESLNLLNIILQLYITNMFLGGEFMTYGSQVMEFMNAAPQNRTDPMYEIFPRLTKCSFHRYGSSGSIERFDALCVLSINILNEKIYVALWFWFLFLLALSIMMVLYRLCTLISGGFRTKILLKRGRSGPRDNAFQVADKCNFGQWYLLTTLGDNMNSAVFSGVLGKLHKALEENDKA